MIPKIRFDGYTDEWNSDSFSNVCTHITVGIANSATHAYVNTGIPMFRNQNIKENFLDESDVIYISEEFAKKYENKRIKANDLLITRTGYPGTACVVPEKFEGSQTFTTLIARIKEYINPFYVCQYINSEYGKQYFLSTQIGGGQKNSGAGILENFPIKVPSTREEQTKLSNYLSELDNYIFLHQHKLTNLQNLKVSMLEKMFPKEGEKVPEIRFEGFTGEWKERKFSEQYKKVSEKNDLSFGSDKIISVANILKKMLAILMRVI